jgi:hypothetical protein
MYTNVATAPLTKHSLRCRGCVFCICTSISVERKIVLKFAYSTPNCAFPSATAPILIMDATGGLYDIQKWAKPVPLGLMCYANVYATGVA